MKASEKILSLLVCILLTISLFVSCASKKNEVGEDAGLSEEEINSQYEEYVKDEKEGLLPEGYNPITDSFTTVDFQFTMTDDTLAFNLPENSFTTITPTSAKYGFLDSSVSGDRFEGSFKTAKGISFSNTVSEFLASYKLDGKYILCYVSEGVYTPFEGNTNAKRISFGFSSLDGLAFSPLSSETLLPLLLNRGEGAFSDADAQKVLGENQTVAIIDVVPQDDGFMSVFTVTRFDKTEKAE